MDKKQLLEAYAKRKDAIQKRLEEFRQLPQESYREELLFCLLTPQSNAYKCWEAVEQLKKLNNPTAAKIKAILRKKTRFHNNKTRYIIKALKEWEVIQTALVNNNKKELRNWLAQEVNGLGLKESAHFLRNIGKSENQVAILDRHILKNLRELKVINNEKIKSKKDYFDAERRVLAFAKSLQIPLDELDLLLWSQETGEIFK